MTDEPTAGQSHEENALEALQDATPEDSTQTEVEDELPERFRGKSPSEIAQSYLELERKLGDQGRELGELKNQIAFQQAQPPYQQPAPQYQQPAYPNPGMGQQPADVNWDDKFLESPTQAMAQWFNQYDQYRRREDSARNFNWALSEAQRSRPDLFDSPETLNQVRQTIQQGVQNKAFLPEVQSDPMSISAIALWLKDQRMQKSPPRMPVNPVQTESPTQVRKPEPGKRQVEFDRAEQDFISHVKTLDGFKEFSDEDAAELVREAEKERNKR